MPSNKVRYHSVETDKDGSMDGEPDDVMHRYTSPNAVVVEKPALWMLAASLAAFMLFLVGIAIGVVGSTSLASSQWTARPQSPAPPVSTLLPPSKTVFDTLRSLPPIDLWKEYGLNSTELNMYPEPLGKKICIINVDTRTWNPGSGLENQGQNEWGWLNHYMYAEMHGYDYRFIQVDNIPGKHATWTKVQELYRVVMEEQYQFVVLTDADVIFPDIRMPLEPLLSYWNVTSDIAITAALDPWGEENKDIHGKYNTNTGFMIAQKTLDLSNLMLDWINCPTGVKYPDCPQFDQAYFHEQSAFSNYVRYDYPDSIRDINFFEANGMTGKFIRHYWWAKDRLREIVKDDLVNLIMPEVLQTLDNSWIVKHDDLIKYPTLMPGIITAVVEPTPAPQPEGYQQADAPQTTNAPETVTAANSSKGGSMAAEATTAT